MNNRWLYRGPDYPTLEHAAFATISEDFTNQPESVLYLARGEQAAAATKDRWSKYANELALSISTFDHLVAEGLERSQYLTRVTHIDQDLRNRLVELALERLESPNPLAVDDDLPSAGLRDQAENLLSLLEFAGLITSNAIEERFREDGLISHVEPIRELKIAFEGARDEVVGDDIANSTLRGERYVNFLSEDCALDDLFPEVDVVVLGGYTLFSPLEQHLVERITQTWPTIALLPQIVPSRQDSADNSQMLTGVDRGAERAHNVYTDLGFKSEYHTGFDHHSQEIRHRIAERLYRHPDEFLSGSITETGGIEWVEPRTVPQELRYIAREIHERLTTGTDPNELAVVLTDSTNYQQQLLETFQRYGIPTALTTNRPLRSTAIGEIILTLCELTIEPRQLKSITSLYANPLVSPETERLDIDHVELSRIAARLSSTQLDAALDYLPSSTIDSLEVLQTRLDVIRTSDLLSFPNQIATLLEDLGVTTAIDDIDDNRRQHVEQQTLERINRILETLADTYSASDLAQGNAAQRFERALTAVTIEAPPYRSDDHVFVGGLGDTVKRTFTHTYLVGLTDSAFPNDSERLAFTEPINEADEDFQQADTQLRARYQFAILLASEGTITLTRPERELNGDPFVEADVLTQLRHVSTVEPTSITDRDQPPCSREDSQRTLARQLSIDDDRTPGDILGPVASTGIFTADRLARLHAGTECAHARQQAAPTAYDGVLDPSLVDHLHPVTGREPYSPSRIETYAECGFKYYLENLLDIEEPEPITHEPDAKTRGDYIHTVLEQFYRSFQSNQGDPISLTALDEERDICANRLLTIALSEIEKWFSDNPTPFQVEWLTKLLAGLGAKDENPYYGSDQYGSLEEGLFVRFLKHEYEDVGKSCVRPAWFESVIGTNSMESDPFYEGQVQISTSSGTVPIGGKIDRIDIDESTNPERIVVRDYKTGNTPNESDTLSGIVFQLPLYALLAEATFENVETVGGAYYQVKPPRKVNHRKGQIGSQELASYAMSGGGTPLTYWQKPVFETNASFRHFLTDIIPQRLDTITTGIEQGWYHPTILEASDAGCSYCPYNDVCDVRHHDRHETVADIQAADGSEPGVYAYVPPAATGDTLDLDLPLEADGGDE